MSLQRRLLLYLLVAAPLVWVVAIVVSVQRAREEVNELFDAEIVRLAHQVQATLAGLAAAQPTPPAAPVTRGEADLREIAIAVWSADGRPFLTDREGAHLPHRTDASGFVALSIGGQPWRAYYLPAAGGAWLVAAGQREAERDALVRDLVASQVIPWLLVLPVLMGVMAWAVRQALRPLRTLTAELRGRDADNLKPLPEGQAPAELRPVLAAMNGLFARIAAERERERRFTADAAHELRTPLAALRAQWDVLRRTAGDDGRRDAERRLSAGLDRLDRLVSQMLALSRLEATDRLPQAEPVDWPAIVEEAMSDVLALAARRGIELGCDWPAAGAAPLPLRGDAGLLAVALRNLLDNAVRYAPAGSSVGLSFTGASLEVANEGAAMPPQVLARLGERFHRAEGVPDRGSGLGLSIVQRIAALHGLRLRYRSGSDGRGVVAELRRS
jgi:two-component system sensor histidine kinase QseC